MLPPKLHAELQKEFDFTSEFHDSNSLFAPLEEGRVLLHLPPPVKQGVPEILINKAFNAKAELVVLVMPADTSTEWFATTYRSDKAETRFIQGRVKYTVAGKVKRVPTCIIIVKGDAYLAKIHQQFIDRQMAKKYGNYGTQLTDRRSG